jgi:hypothetical protein
MTIRGSVALLRFPDECFAKGTSFMVTPPGRVEGTQPSTSPADPAGGTEIAIRRSKTSVLMVPESLLTAAVNPPPGTGASKIESMPVEMVGRFIHPLLDEDHPTAAVRTVLYFVASSRTVLTQVLKGTCRADVDKFFRLERLGSLQREIAGALKKHGFEGTLGDVESGIRDESTAAALVDWLRLNPGNSDGPRRISKTLHHVRTNGQTMTLARANLLIAARTLR